MKIITAGKSHIKDVAEIHLSAFSGFFLTFLGKGFLKCLYKGFVRHNESDLLVAVDDDGKTIGFAAFSKNLSAFYKFLIRTRLVPFAWYSFIAFLKKPKVFMRLIKALSAPKESERTEKYLEISSIGVLPEMSGKGIGTALLKSVTDNADFMEYAYIKLETDAENNAAANAFYQKNGFEPARTYTTAQGRKMNEYRYYPKK